jgi:hypothetical protein
MDTIKRLWFALFILTITASNSIAGGVVYNTNDSGFGSLREACATGGMVSFSAALVVGGSVTITLNSEIVISGDVTINGIMNATDTVYVSGNNSSRIFRISGSNTSTSVSYLNNLAMIDGNAGTSYGGAVSNSGCDLRLENCMVRTSTARWGGAINQYGGGSWNFDLTVNNSSFYDNTATSYGGALHCSSSNAYAESKITVNSSSLYGNNANSGGSAVYCSSSVSSANFPGSVSCRININQSTICNNLGLNAIDTYCAYSNNSSSSAHSKIYVYNSTIFDNNGYGIAIYGESSSYIYLKSSIVAENGIDHYNIISYGNNIFSQSTVTGSSGADQTGVNSTVLGLGALAYYGGSTKTRVPMIGSVAINNGSPSDVVDAQNAPIIGVRDVGSAEQTSTFGTDIQTACDSYTWIDGITYLSDNFTATHTLVNSNGYDSIVTLNLSVFPSYNLGKIDTVCDGDTYFFGTQTLTTEGAYSETFNSINGCDSIVNLTLEVNNPTSSTDVVASCDSYEWIDGNTYLSNTNSPTWRLTNSLGCDSVITLNLTIGDFEIPIADLNSLADVTAQCEITALTAPTATDNCSGSITGTHDASFPITSNTTVTWTYADGNGNSSNQTQSVVLNDITAPVVDVALLADVTAQCEVTSLIAPTATDNCEGAITGTPSASLPITSNTTITWTYDDGKGNSSTQTQSVVFSDITAPVADVVSLADITDQCEVTSLATPTATDNCEGAIIGIHNASLPISSTTTITWTYTDGNGNSSTQTQNVVINDNTLPVADAVSLADVAAQCDVTSLVSPTATDNCVGVITGTHNASLPITSNTTITWTYDDGSGNTSTQTQNVVVNDNIAPVAVLANLPDVTAQCEVTSLTAPTAVDNCEGAITGTYNVSLPIITNTTITWTYNDGNGNTSTQTQNVVINDFTPPVADAGSLADVNDQCEVTALSSPTATDNCAGTVTGSHNASFPITTTSTIIWTFDDGNGNTSIQTQSVVISDFTLPTPDALSLADVNNQCEVPFLSTPTATDNCAGTVTGTHNASFPITTTTTVTWTFDDGNGNSSTQTQNVVINDVTSPVPDFANLQNVTDECDVTSLSDPTATDNCSGSIIVTHDASFPITSNTTVTWFYDDGNGNSSTQTQEVEITPIGNSVSQIGAITLMADETGYDYQWVDCNNGSSPIAGETDQNFTAVSNGSYAVEIDNGNCTVTSNCVQILTVGIRTEESNINVFGSSSTIHVNLTKAETGTITVLDMSGRTVHTQSINSDRTNINLNTAAGIYVVQVEISAQTITKKISIQ